MAFGKTAAQKAADAAEKAARQAESDTRQQSRRSEMDAERWRRGPVGMAATAKEQGQGFYEVQLDVGSSQRGVTFGSADLEKRRDSTTYAGVLSEIESIGWRLEHVGYIFLVTGESSRDKLLSTGQATAVSGKTVGIYLFRNIDSPSASGVVDPSSH